jgi:putative ABC transport system permease protein
MVVGDVRPALRILMGAVALVLLIACANVAHLQLLRAAARSREGAVRVALGASRVRLMQQSLVESTLLSLGGAALGLLVAWGGVGLLVRLSPRNLPRLADIRLDGAVYAFLVLAALLSSVLFGLAPALKASRLEIGDALKEGSRSTSDGPRSKRLRGLLVISEFATALVLLVGASLLLRSFAKLSAVDTGFGARNALTFAVSLRGTGHAEAAARDPFYRDLLERLRALPGVEAAGAVNHLPIAGDNWRFTFVVEGRPVPPPDEAPRALFRVVRPGYFAAMQVPLLRGRDVAPGDGKVVVINQTMAQHYWPGTDPIGQRISVDDPGRHADWYTVVGVVHDLTQRRIKERATEEMFFPALPYDPAVVTGLRSALYPSEMMFVLRASGDPAALSRPVQDLVRSLDADAPVHDIATMRTVIGTQFVEPTFYLLLLGSFAGLAVVLAAVGVYGVLSYSARRRSHEMGVRMALGAGPSEPFRLVAGEGMRLAAAGAVLGLLAALVLTRQLRTLLFGVEPTDPLMFGAAVAVLGLIALLACWVPARRAARTDPMAALRSE